MAVSQFNLLCRFYAENYGNPAKENQWCLRCKEIPGSELDSHGRSDSDQKRILCQISLLSPIFHASHTGFKKPTSMFWGEEKWSQAQIQYGETTDERCITCPEARDIPQESTAKITRKISTNKYIVSYGLKIIKKTECGEDKYPIKNNFFCLKYWLAWFKSCFFNQRYYLLSANSRQWNCSLDWKFTAGFTHASYWKRCTFSEREKLTYCQS